MLDLMFSDGPRWSGTFQLLSTYTRSTMIQQNFYIRFLTIKNMVLQVFGSSISHLKTFLLVSGSHTEPKR